MAWSQIVGHTVQLERFRRSASRNRLAGSYLFIGPAGIGKRSFALQLARTLLCEGSRDAFDSCDACAACRQVAAGSHPDLQVVSKPPDKSYLPIELLIGDREHRMQEGLCHHIALSPFRAGRKLAILDDADALNVEGANCLLKTLEEPPPRAVVILIGTSLQKQLPTIRSRCQVVHFHRLDRDQVRGLIERHHLLPEGADVEQAVQLCEGSLELAGQLADPQLINFRGSLLEVLAARHWDVVQLARQLGEFVNAAGKEPAHRRARLRQLLRFTLDFYRDLLRARCGAGDAVRATPWHVIDQALAEQPLDVERNARCVDRCLDAISQLEANANQATLLESWLDDLARLSA